MESRSPFNATTSSVGGRFYFPKWEQPLDSLCTPTFSTPFSNIPPTCWSLVLVCYCCITNHHKLDSLNNNTHLWSHSFHGSGIWAQPSWVFCSGSWGCYQGVSRAASSSEAQCPLPGSLVLGELGSLWLQTGSWVRGRLQHGNVLPSRQWETIAPTSSLLFYGRTDHLLKRALD